MPGKNKKEKKPMCQYERHDYKCNRSLYDGEYCIFHSKEIEKKKDQFDDAFWQEYETQKVNERFNFVGFVFPDRFNLKKIDLKKAFLQGIILPGAELQEASLNGANLQNAHLERANLQKAFLKGTNLQGANIKCGDLREADLRGAILQEADLKEAKLQGARLQDANFKGAILREANLKGAFLLGSGIQGANLQKADLEKADLQGAKLRGAKLQGAKLQGTKLQGAKLPGANLHAADLQEASLQGADLSSANLKSANLSHSSLEKALVKKVKFNRFTRCLGIDVTRAKGSPRFVRFAKDQEYLEEFRSSWKRYPLYIIWLMLADCGRSMLIWLFWSICMALGFAIKFFSLGPGAFCIKQPLEHSLDTMIYYSVVTFTTLGFGDITPNTIEASRWVMAEVILGYIMLGGLISIFANKLARRS